MALKQRGQEATIRIAVDGVLREGSFLKVTDFTATPRTDITEDDYLGEQESDLDIQHNGWDLGFSVDTVDEEVIEFIEDVISRETDHIAHPDITITVLSQYREASARAKIAVYHGVFLKCDEESFGGRKEKVKGKFSGKCKKRTVLNA